MYPCTIAGSLLERVCNCTRQFLGLLLLSKILAYFFLLISKSCTRQLKCLKRALNCTGSPQKLWILNIYVLLIATSNLQSLYYPGCIFTHRFSVRLILSPQILENMIFVSFIFIQKLLSYCHFLEFLNICTYIFGIFIRTLIYICKVWILIRYNMFIQIPLYMYETKLWIPMYTYFDR